MFFTDESVIVEEILCGSIGVGEDDHDKIRSVRLNVTLGEDVEASDRKFHPDEEIKQFLRQNLGSVNITSTPITSLWPIYTERRINVLGDHEEPPCKTVMSVVPSESGTVGGGELARGSVTNANDGVPEIFVKSGGFVTMEDIARRQAVERAVLT